MCDISREEGVGVGTGVGGGEKMPGVNNCRWYGLVFLWMSYYGVTVKV